MAGVNWFWTVNGEQITDPGYANHVANKKSYYLGIAQNQLINMKRINSITQPGLRKFKFTQHYNNECAITTDVGPGYEKIFVDLLIAVQEDKKALQESKKEDSIMFTLWFFQDATTIVEFDPKSEKLTGKKFTTPESVNVGYSGNLTGGGLLFAHGSLWFRRDFSAFKLDVSTGELLTINGVVGGGYYETSFIATEDNIVIVDSVNGLTLIDQNGKALANYNEFYPLRSVYDPMMNGLSAVKLINENLYVYSWDSNYTYDKLAIINSVTFNVLSDTIDIFAKRNTNYSGEFGSLASNIAYDSSTGKVHGKWTWFDSSSSGGSDIYTTVRGNMQEADFVSGALNYVWSNYWNTSDEAQYSDGNTELRQTDTIIPIASKSIYVVLTAGANGTSYHVSVDEFNRARIYNSEDDSLIASIDSSNVKMVGHSDVSIRAVINYGVWDGMSKVWAIFPSQVNYGQLCRVDLDDLSFSSIEVGAIADFYAGGARIAVQPKLFGSQLDGRTEMDWVLVLQEASVR